MKTCIVGASGYTGAELANLIVHHPAFTLDALYVSKMSVDAGKSIGNIHGHLRHLPNAVMTPLTDALLTRIGDDYDFIFLATPHEASHDWMPNLINKRAKIVDLSGAFRLKNRQIFAEHYGFEHQHPDLLSKAVYGLAEWYADDIRHANLIAVPGCYPTASLTATKPLAADDLLDNSHLPIVNAVSGVSGAGRKTSLTNSFCEVSLQAYGLLHHRHTPEIATYLGNSVIFTPHLGNFKRGILATITCRLKAGVTQEQIDLAYHRAYAHQPLVRLCDAPPKISDVVGQPFCDLYWQYDPGSGYLVISAAIDNLLKGAASQAMQCANMLAGFEQTTGLLTRSNQP